MHATKASHQKSTFRYQGLPSPRKMPIWRQFIVRSSVTHSGGGGASNKLMTTMSTTQKAHIRMGRTVRAISGKTTPTAIDAPSPMGMVHAAALPVARRQRIPRMKMAENAGAKCA